MSRAAFAVLLVFALTLLCHVSAHPASPLAVAVVIEQFKNAKIVPDILPTFNPTGLCNLNYTGYINKTQVGDTLPKSLTATAPINVYIHGTAAAEATAGGPFNVTTIKYTVLIIDAGPPGSTNPQGYNLHWLANNWTYGENDDHTVTLNPPASSVVTYQAPAPASGSGPHRYITLVYPQPDNFKVPQTPAIGSGVALFNLTQYKADSGLTTAIVGTYFTVEEGTATVSVASTTAVVSTTLPQYTPSATSTAPATAHSSNDAKGGNSIRSELWMGAISMILGLILRD